MQICSQARAAALPARAVAWLGLAALAAAGAAAAPPPFVLDLPGGGTLPGDFSESPAPADGPRATLRWQAAPFAAPFEFRLDAIAGVRAVTSEPPAGDGGLFRCQLQGGDVIDGRLESIAADELVLAPADGGDPIRIDRTLVTGLRRRAAGGGGGYVGPGGLTGWQQEPVGSWRDEAARLVCDRRSSTVTREIAAPPRARYDIVLSWRETPEVVVAIAAGDGTAPDPYRFELLEVAPGIRTGLIARQERQGGSLEEVAVPPPVKGRLRLSLFIDTVAGRLAAAVEGGERVIDTTVKPAEPGRGGRFRLTLLSGDVCLESLRVSDWTAADPLMADTRETTVKVRGGRTITGAVESLAVAGVVVATAAGRETIPVEDLEAIEFAAAGTAEPAADGPEPAIRVVQRSGGVVTGRLIAVAAGAVWLERPGITGRVRVPLPDLRSLVSLQAADPPPLPHRPGALVVGDARVPGCLVDGAEQGGGLAWLPRGSLTSSRFASAGGAALAAEVEYVAKSPPREDGAGPQVEVGGIGGAVNIDEVDGSFVVTMLSEEGAAARDGRIQPGDRLLAVRPLPEGPFVEAKGLDLETVMNLLRGRVGTPVGVRVETPGGRPRTIDLVRGIIYIADREILDRALAAHARMAAGHLAADPQQASYPAVAILVSGDMVPAAVERIDATGVRLRSPVTESGGRRPVTVANPLVKAIDFDPAAASKGIPKAQFERLLTLPRAQQADPPTHLLRLRSGDYLRGRLVTLDEAEVVFDVLGQKKRLARTQVVRLIWLHPASPAAQAGAADGEANPAPDGLVVQGVAQQGERTTLVAERVAEGVIIGRSLAFGPSRIDTMRIERLLIGGAIAADQEDLSWLKWKLKPAALPRALRERE